MRSGGWGSFYALCRESRIQPAVMEEDKDEKDDASTDKIALRTSSWCGSGCLGSFSALGFDLPVTRFQSTELDQDRDGLPTDKLRNDIINRNVWSTEVKV